MRLWEPTRLPAMAKQQADRRVDCGSRVVPFPSRESERAAHRIRTQPCSFRLRVSCGRALALLQDPVAVKLGDLDGIERRALAQVVGHAPEVQAVVDG